MEFQRLNYCFSLAVVMLTEKVSHRPTPHLMVAVAHGALGNLINTPYKLHSKKTESASRGVLNWRQSVIIIKRAIVNCLLFSLKKLSNVPLVALSL